MKRICQLVLPGLAAGLVATGCRGFPTASEELVRGDFASVSNQLQVPAPAWPTNATLESAVTFALRGHPQVKAAFADWADSVENITVARSLPDPKLTFELYAGDVLTSLMPGLMAEFPGPGKLRALANAAFAGSRVKYFQFESATLQTAFGVEQSFYPLHFLEAKIQVNRQSLALLTGLETLARAQNEVGRATLQDVLRAQIEQEKLQTETENLEDSRRVLLARFKSALGLPASAADPPVPETAAFTETNSVDEEWLAAALRQNPRLEEMRAEMQVAEASIHVAREEKIPDFAAGGEVDVKASPWVWNPQFSMTLPIWRDKLAAELAAAQAAKRGAEARLSAQQLALAVEFAEQTYLIREANRGLRLLRGQLLPQSRQALEIARAAYRSGQVDFLNVIDDERALLDFQLNEIAALTQREIARAQLTLLIAGVPPEGAPWLKSPTQKTERTR